jgi:hypothetical protein
MKAKSTYRIIFGIGLLVVFVLLSIPKSCWTNPNILGHESQVKTQPISVSDALSTQYFDKTVRCKGNVRSICPDDQCWLVVTDNSNVIRTEFINEEFTVPNSIVGKQIVIEGTVSEKIISKNSSGYSEYEHSCGYSDTSTLKHRRVPVFTAYRVEVQ